MQASGFRVAEYLNHPIRIAAIARSQSLIAAVLGPEELLRLAAENVVLAHARGLDLAGAIEELRRVLDREQRK
jgi:hypothetical protein